MIANSTISNISPMTYSKSCILEHLVLVGLLLNLIIPTVVVGIGFNIVTPVSFLLCVLLLTKKVILFNTSIIIYFLFCLSIFLSMNYGYLFLSVDFTYRDYMELFRVAQYIPYLVACRHLHYFNFIKILNSYVIFCSIYIVVVCFLQVTNIFNIAEILGSIYSNPNHTSAMISGSNRIIATASNPNDGALVLSFFFFLNLFVVKLNKIFRFLICSLLFVFILYTQSRTVLVGFTFCFAACFFLFFHVQLLIKLILGLFLTLMIVIIINYINLDYVFVGFQMAFAGENQSVNVRLENIHLAFQRFYESIFFGFGPAKSIFNTTVDSEYAMVLQRYGLFGLLLMLIYYFFIFYKARLNYKDFILQKNVKIFCTTFASLSFFVMLTNNFFSGYQTGSIPVLLLLFLTITSSPRV